MQMTSPAELLPNLNENQAPKFLRAPVRIQTPVIEPMAITRLRPYSGNARTHSKKQIRQIADSIKRFGFTNPVLISDDDEIIAGHGRVEAARLLAITNDVQWRLLPTVSLSQLTRARARRHTQPQKLAAGML